MIKETAAMTNTSVADVKDILVFVGNYTAKVIRKGTFSSVMLPYFGKFSPMPKSIEAVKKKKSGSLSKIKQKLIEIEQNKINQEM